MRSRLREWALRLWSAVTRRRRDADLQAELQSHLALAADEASRRRVSTRALLHGNVAATLDALRDQRGVPLLDQLCRDVRDAWRGLRRRRRVAVVAAITLSLGLAAEIAIFAVVHGVLLKPLPYPDADRLVAVWQTAPGAPGVAAVSGDLRLSASMYFTYAEHTRAFDAFGIWYPTAAVVTGSAGPEQVRAVAVSDGVLDALGIAPEAGRPFAPGDQIPGAPEVVLLSHGFWMRHFSGSTDAIGRALVVDSRPREIVGVMPREFVVMDAPVDIVVPARFDRSRATLPGFGFLGLARLKPGVSIDEANADLARMLPLWMASWPAAPGVDPRVYEQWRITPALRPLKDDLIGSVERPLWLLMGTTVVVLLIALANVANLLLVQMEGRRHEFAIRAALGAGRRRLARAVLVESLMLASIAGVLAVGLAQVGLGWLLASGVLTLPRTSGIAIDVAVIVQAIATMTLTGLILGAIPALRRSREPLSARLQAGGRSGTSGPERHRTRSGLVVAQVALSAILLIGAGLMMRTLHALQQVDPGFDPSPSTHTARISIFAAIAREQDHAAQLQRDIVETLGAIPGVQAVGFASTLPMDGAPPDWDAISVEGVEERPGEVPPFRLFKAVSPGFFEAIGTPVIAGRAFTWIDLSQRHHVVLVSEALAREVWGSASAAIGRRIRTLPGAPWKEVIGVVHDVHERGAHRPAPAIVYWPTFGAGRYRPGVVNVARTVTLAVKTSSAAPEEAAAAMRRAIWSVNAGVPITAEQTLHDLYARSMAQTSLTLLMLGLAAAMGLAIGLIGLYGLIAYDVACRTREIGIRLALGANGATVRRAFIVRGAALALVGVTIAVPAAMVLSRFMTALIYGVSVVDPITYTLATILLAAVTIGGSALAARRSTLVDPVTVLRGE